ncbi:MAG: arsenic efflux protein [Firmicutes bacterium]|nr:arsenic efflux protein [Bacillota bacterium]
MGQMLCQIEWGGAPDVLLDALKDSAIILPVLFLAHVLMAFIDRYTGKRTQNALKGPFAPLIGAAAGVFPQCGFSVAATRMYAQKYIPLGALIAVYITTSDEALLILLALSPEKVLPLLIIKLIFALFAGYVLYLAAYLAAKRKRRGVTANGEVLAVDNAGIFMREKGARETHEHRHEALKQENTPENVCKTHEHEAVEGDREHGAHKINEQYHVLGENCGCGCHGHKHCKKESAWHTYLLHPLIHSLKLFVYILAVNLILGFIIFFVTPERFTAFVTGLSVWQPALAALIGLIPNCAAGVILAHMYADNLLTLGAAVAGLTVAAGLSYAVLVKEHKNKLTVLLIVLGMFASGTLLGILVDVII